MVTKDEDYEFKKVLSEHYPDLKGKNIQLDEGFANFGAGAIFFPIFDALNSTKKDGTYFLGYNSSTFNRLYEKFNDSGFRGFAAHELSHIVLGDLEEDYIDPSFEDSFYKKICGCTKKILSVIFSIKYNLAMNKETASDDDVIRRGLGKDLLATKRMCTSPNGYTPRKLEKILSRSAGV